MSGGGPPGIWTTEAKDRDGIDTCAVEGFEPPMKSDPLHKFTLKWEGPDAPPPLTVEITELPSAPRFAPEKPTQLKEIDTDCTDLGEIFEAIRCLANGPDHYVTLNGRWLVSVRDTTDGWAFVPEDFLDFDFDYETVFESSANWESNGPMTFDQSETLVRFDTFYVLKSSGDISNEVVAIGTHSNDTRAGMLAAEVSEFLSVSPEGIFESTLDEIPDPYPDI